MNLKSILHSAYLTLNPTAVTPRAHGIDISKYDTVFNPELAKNQLDFVIQRVSYRTTRDEAFEALVPGVMAMPVRGAYHYLNSGTDWLFQADRFLSFVNGYEYHFYVCDFEDAFNTMSLDFAYTAWKWIHFVKDRTGRPVFLYTSPSLYNQYIYPSQARYGINWNDVPLWTAQWFWVPNPNGTPTNPLGRTAGWKLWQYTDKGDGTLYGAGRTTACDLNVWNGGVEDMKQFLNIADTPQGDAMYKGIVVYDGAKVWNAPGGTQITSLRSGTNITGDLEQTVSGVKYLRLLTPVSGWTKATWLSYAPVVVEPPPPPPPTPGPTLTHTIQVYSDGSIAIDGVPFP